MKKEEKFLPPKRKQPVWRVVAPIFKIFYKKPEIVYLGKKLEEPCIMVANHAAKRGPMVYELYMPIFNAKWGAGEMLGNYKSRFTYLRDIFYIKKRGFGKFRATIKAGFEALFNLYLYKGMKFLGTYPDARLMKTISNSVEVLKDGTSILIFPENSNEGYKDIPTEFFPGFVMLAESYYRKTKTDLPIYPCYYSVKHNVIVYGEPCYVQDLVKQGLDRYQIAEEFRKKVVALYTDYILTDEYKNLSK
ncbi:MAG: hypothetical protein E7370_06190 [Clostridiales bacterium]|nr:hypothetical protein [Clostridiales bacterium]